MGFINKLFNDYYPYLKKDFIEVSGYVWLGIALGAAGTLVLFALLRIITRKKYGYNRLFPLFLFLTYAAIVVQIVYFSREPDTRTTVTLGLGDTWGVTMQAHAYVIENILLFIPFGILLPMLGKWSRKFCLPIALLATVCIETAQYISGRGFFQTDDIVTNLGGAVIGYIIYMLIYLLLKLIRYIVKGNNHRRK